MHYRVLFDELLQDWFEATEMRGLVEKDRGKEFQVTVKIGFRLEEQPA